MLDRHLQVTFQEIAQARCLGMQAWIDLGAGEEDGAGGTVVGTERRIFARAATSNSIRS